MNSYETTRAMLDIADDVYRTYMTVATCGIPVFERSDSVIYASMRNALIGTVAQLCVDDTDLATEVMRRIDESNESVSSQYPLARAEAIGRMHGKSAALWVEIDSVETAQKLIDTDANGELDSPNPLSGEWADGYSERDLRLECGLPTDDEDIDMWYSATVADAYESAYKAEWLDSVIGRATEYLS